MANLLEKMNYSIVSLPKAINRTNPIPLDNSTVWTDFDELRNYAQTSPIAYVGQILSLVEYDSENGEISNTKAYIIKDKIGNIEEIGSIKNGDNVSIEFTNGAFSIKNFGKYYYKYITPTENNENAHYELTEGWIAGLEPKVVEENGVMTIGWYESASIVSENIQNQIINI